MNSNSKQSAVDTLRETLNPGDTVHTVLRHVSRSGMNRSISPIISSADGPWDASGVVAGALNMTFDRTNGGVKVAGCGMDMGFSLVYNLSATLCPAGHGCPGENCRSNDHSNGDRDYTKHTKRRPHWHNDGGYALRHCWL